MNPASPLWRSGSSTTTPEIALRVKSTPGVAGSCRNAGRQDLGNQTKTRLSFTSPSNTAVKS